jgi:hypothetical protein
MAQEAQLDVMDVTGKRVQIDPLLEIGGTGLNTWGGFIAEEFVKELQGQRGMKIYREMAENDDIVGSMLFAFEQLMRQVEWRIEGSEDEEAQGQRKSEKYVKLVEGALFEDLNQSWPEVLSEILTMLPYGFSIVEVTYKKRQGERPRRTGDEESPKSRFKDGYIGWRKWAIRAQETLNGWEFDEDGGIRGVWQELPDKGRVFLPIEKCLLFRTSTRRGNPEGRSLLRNAYKSYYYKRRIQEIEGIGIERDLAGIPVITPPEGLDIWNPNDSAMVQMKTAAETLVRNIRRDEQEGVLKPYGWSLELLGSSSRRQFDTSAIITRYDQRIAMSVLADFILIGHDAVGSKAMVVSKARVFALAVEAFLDSICEVVNRFAIPRLMEVNGFDLRMSPRLVHGKIDPVDPAELGAYLTALSGAGMPLFPNPELERYLLEVANLPTPAEGEKLPSEVLQEQQEEEKERQRALEDEDRERGSERFDIERESHQLTVAEGQARADAKVAQQLEHPPDPQGDDEDEEA